MLVVGAGDPAEQVVRDLLQHPRVAYEVVGLVGGDARETGLRIHAVPIAGGYDDLDHVLRVTRPTRS